MNCHVVGIAGFESALSVGCDRGGRALNAALVTILVPSALTRVPARDRPHLTIVNLTML